MFRSYLPSTRRTRSSAAKQKRLPLSCYSIVYEALLIAHINVTPDYVSIAFRNNTMVPYYEAVNKGVEEKGLCCDNVAQSMCENCKNHHDNH